MCKDNIYHLILSNYNHNSRTDLDVLVLKVCGGGLLCGWKVVVSSSRYSSVKLASFSLRETK